MRDRCLFFLHIRGIIENAEKEKSARIIDFFWTNFKKQSILCQFEGEFSVKYCRGSIPYLIDCWKIISRRQNGVFMSQTDQKNKYLEDNDIIDMYWNRNEKAIEETDRKYGRFLYRIAYNIIYNHPDCEECLNDTYLSTWNTVPPTIPIVFQSFLSKIMRNVAVDKLRERGAAKRIPSELIVSIDEIGEMIPYNEENEAIEAIAEILNGYLRELDDREQLIFVCRYYYCDRVSEIAEMLNVSDRTVFRMLSSIKDGLKSKFDEEGINI